MARGVVRVSVMALWGVLAAGSVGAQTLSAQATLTNIQFTATPLSTAGGAVATIQFGRDTSGGWEPVSGWAMTTGRVSPTIDNNVVGHDGNGFYFYEPLPQEGQSALALDGRGYVSVSSAAYQASAQLSASDTLPSPYTASGRGASVGSQANFGEYVSDYMLAQEFNSDGSVTMKPQGDPNFDMGANFELSAHSSVTFSATATLSLAWSGGMPANLSYFDPLNGAEQYSGASASASLMVQRITPLMPLASTYEDRMALSAAYAQAYEIQMAMASLSWFTDRGDMPDGSAQELTLTLRNDSDVAIRGVLVMGVGANVVINETVTPVPEPATWALMGLGLVGVSAFARRRPC